MINVGDILLTLWESSGFAYIVNNFINVGATGFDIMGVGAQNLIMIIIACVLLYLGIGKKFEPLLMVGIAIEEWWMAGWQGYPDPVMLCCALLVLLPGFYTWFYVPAKMKKTAGRQYDRSVSAGMLYCGRLTVTPDYVEKAGATATAHIRMDDRTLFIESAEMMAFVTAGSPALVLPARGCGFGC